VGTKKANAKSTTKARQKARRAGTKTPNWGMKK
jgi:hypothetical protein